MLADPRPSFLSLPSRSIKPRQAGLTHVIDNGVSLSATRDTLDQASGLIDIWKFGWGLSYIDPNVRVKVAELRASGVRACTGGTLMEIAWQQGKTESLLKFTAEVGFDCVEVSDGATDMPLDEKRALISRARDLGFEVLAEVGSKNPQHVMAPGLWIDEIEGDLAAGASWIVAEGRESGTVGLYDADGRARCNLIEVLCGSPHAGKFIYEAPQRAQQVFMIKHAGASVNLGNIQLGDILALESLRLGLRADTMAGEPLPVGSANVRF